MNLKRLRKALCWAILLCCSIFFAVHGVHYLLWNLPKWLLVSGLVLISITFLTFCIYKAEKYKEEINADSSDDLITEQ